MLACGASREETRVRAFAAIFAVLCFGCQRDAGGAQKWPQKPIRFIVPFAPGGPADTIARLIGYRLSSDLGQQVVVENRPGAGGNIGAAAAAKSPPDGYTALVTTSAFAVNVTLSPNPGYDAGKDFIPTALIASQPNAIIVNATLPAKTLADLLSWAKTAKPGFATPGSGTTPHLTAEHLFRFFAKLDMTAIHFKGAAPAITAVLASQPPVGSAAISTALPHIQSGKLRALAVSSAKRIAALPDVPTLAECGVADVEDYTWIGIFFPAGTPAVVVDRTNGAVNRALEDPEIRSQLDRQAYDPVGGTPSDFAGFVRAEIGKWEKIVREANIQAE
jgi:tripartite-type tricarboxylate transporter receptor subunit TctC